MEGYVLSTKSCPPKLISEGSEMKSNPAYEEWVSSDQLLLGWIYNTLTPEIASQLIGCGTSFELWTAIRNLVGAHTRSRITLLKGELHRTRKGSLKMSEYLSKMKTISDNLLLVGCPIPTSDLIIQTLTGLDIEYNPIVVQLSDKTDLTWVDLQATLLTFESRMEQLSSLTNSFQAQANIASNNYKPKNAYVDLSNNSWRGQNSNNRGGRSSRGSRGRSGGRNNRPICQVCGKTGHPVAHCYFRFNQSYMGSVPYSNSGQGKVISANSQHSYQPHPAYVASASTVADSNWYMDSGASAHITNDQGNIDHSNRSHGKEEVIVGNGEKLVVQNTGFASLPCKSQSLKLNNVLHTPQVTKNLLSVSKLTSDNNILVEFDCHGCYVKDKTTRETLLRGTMRDRLYEFHNPRLQPDNTAAVSLFSAASSNQMSSDKHSWHLRLGHPSDRVLHYVLKECNIKINNNRSYFCEACQFGKNKALPFNLSQSRAKFPLDLIHTDIWGPSPIQSTSSFRFYVQFLDDHTRYSWIFPLKNKSEALTTFIQFKQFVEKQFERKIKMLQSDWGGEYRSFTQLMQNEGIAFRQSCPYTSVQNGRVERRHRKIVDCGLTLLAQASMPLHYWWEAFQTSVHLINRLPSTVLNNQSPYKVLFKENPDYKSLKIFRCACYPNLRVYNSHKFSFHSTKCVYLGLSQHHKGFLCLSSIGRLYISWHVVFNEQEFPFSSGFMNTKQSEQSVEYLSSFPFSSWQQEPRIHADESGCSSTDQHLVSSPISVSNPESCSSTKSIPGDSSRQPIANNDQLKDCPDFSNGDSKSANTKQCGEQSSQVENRVITRSMRGITKPKQPYIGILKKQNATTEP